MFSHKWRQASVMAVLLALGLVTAVLFALQSTTSNAQTKKESTLDSEVDLVKIRFSSSFCCGLFAVLDSFESISQKNQ